MRQLACARCIVQTTVPADYAEYAELIEEQNLRESAKSAGNFSAENRKFHCSFIANSLQKHCSFYC